MLKLGYIKEIALRKKESGELLNGVSLKGGV